MKNKIILLAILITVIVSTLTVQSIAETSERIKMYETVDKEEVGKDQDWKHKFTLPKYNENGEIISYEVDEEEVPDIYTKKVEGNTIINSLNTYNYRVEYYYDAEIDDSKTEYLSAVYGSIINSYTDKNITGFKLDYVVGLGLVIGSNIEENVIRVFYGTEKIELTGTKIWKDDNNSQGLRPKGYTLKLYANGKYIKEEYFTDTIWTFVGLPKYSYETGEEIQYTIQEDEIILDNGDKYVPTIDGNIITNTLTGTTEIEVKKEWDDANNIYETRPESIILTINKTYLI